MIKLTEMDKQKGTTSSSALTGAHKVRAFFDALAAGADAGSQEFGQILLQKHGPGTGQSFLETEDWAEYELLMEIARDLLEAELGDSLGQFERKEINQKEVSTLCAAFWGVLMMHIQLFLPQPPLTGQALLAKVGGEYWVGFPGKTAFTVSAPFSTGKIKSLVVSLGNDWLVRYLEEYILNQKIPELYQSLALKQTQIFGWLEGKSSRWLNQAQANLCTKLWAVQTGQDNADSMISRQHLAREHLVTLEPKASSGQEVGREQVGDDRDDLVSQYSQKLDELLSSQENPPFVVPDLQVEDEQGNLIPASLEDLAGIQGFNLLVGLPGGGKSRVQAWAARKRLSENREVGVFLDLLDHMQSGMPSLFDEVAMQWMHSFGSQAGFDELRSNLIAIERRGSLYWQIDNWDQVSENDQTRILPSLTRLAHVLLSVSDPGSVLDKVRDLRLERPMKVYHILPFSNQHQLKYVEQRALPPAESLHVRERIKQIPGLGALPAGIVVIAKNPSRSIIDILIDYLDAQQRARNNQAVILSLKQKRNTCNVDWHNPQVNAVYAIVAALQKHGPSRQYNVSRLFEMDPILVGAYLHSPTEEMETRIKKAERLLKTGCEAGLLYRTEKGHYSFVVSEIGYLMAAIAVYSAYEPKIMLKEALDSLALHPRESSAQILSAFADWMLVYPQPDFNRNKFQNPGQGIMGDMQIPDSQTH